MPSAMRCCAWPVKVTPSIRKPRAAVIFPAAIPCSTFATKVRLSSSNASNQPPIKGRGGIRAVPNSFHDPMSTMSLPDACRPSRIPTLTAVSAALSWRISARSRWSTSLTDTAHPTRSSAIHRQQCAVVDSRAIVVHQPHVAAAGCERQNLRRKQRHTILSHVGGVGCRRAVIGTGQHALDESRIRRGEFRVSRKKVCACHMEECITARRGLGPLARRHPHRARAGSGCPPCPAGADAANQLTARTRRGGQSHPRASARIAH